MEYSAKPLISFIVTVNNVSRDELTECLKSILQLSLSDKEREIILVDDGSEDFIINMVDSFKDDIIYIRQRKQGRAVARNTGLKMAKGKYIQFVNGGDLLLRAPYEHCLDIARYHEPDIVFFMQTDKEDVETPFEFNAPISGSSYLHDNDLRTNACCYIFRYRLLLNLRFSPYLLNEDEEFTPQLFLRADKLICTNSKAYCISKGSEVQTKQQPKRSTLQSLAEKEHIIYNLQYVAEQLTPKDKVALKRRIAQLTLELIYDTITITRSNRHTEETINRLHAKGLYPLPDKNYDNKYRLLRKAINSKLGRKLLLISLPKRNL